MLLSSQGDFKVSDDNETSVISVDGVLEGIRHNNVKQVFVVGLDDNDEMYVASNIASLAKFVFLLERAKLMLLTGEFEQNV